MWIIYKSNQVIKKHINIFLSTENRQLKQNLKNNYNNNNNNDNNNRCLLDCNVTQSKINWFLHKISN